MLATNGEQSEVYTSYRTAVRSIRERVNAYIDTEHAPLKINRSQTLSSRYELIRTNIYHLLSVVESQKNREMAKKILADSTIISDLDQSVAYFRHILERITIIDAEGVIERAADGEPFLFALTHTGPFFFPLFLLVSKEIHIALSVPPGVSDELLDTCEQQLSSYEKNYLTLMEMNGANYIRRLKELIKASQASVVTYFDGYRGSYSRGVLLKDVRAQDVCKFLQAEITPLAAVHRLAHFLNLDLVPICSSRQPDLRWTIRIGRPIHTREESSSAVMQRLYGFLESAVTEVPTQWEGWVYFHNFLSVRYRERIQNVIEEQVASSSGNCSRDRYFLVKTSEGMQIMDRVALKMHPLSVSANSTNPPG